MIFSCNVGSYVEKIALQSFKYLRTID